MFVRERLGAFVGWLAAPIFGAVGRARHTRVLHPEGIVLLARVEPIASRSGRACEAAVAERLAGPALVRFSTAIWREGKEWPDVLGCAIRFRSRDEASADPEPDDQDLLFATIRSPWTTFLGPVGTHVHDFLANMYFATAPFDVPGVGRAKWRLVHEREAGAGTDDGDGAVDRRERLVRAIHRGAATLRLEVRCTFHAGWSPVARVVLVGVADVDQDRLRFSPFRSGRGVRPRGFVHALRKGAYAASQATGHVQLPFRP